MNRRQIVVQKFGSSVLGSDRDLEVVVSEIYREIRRGHRVVAVVSAFGSTTNGLDERAHDISKTPRPSDLALLLSSGEAQAAALLSLALDAAGISATALTATQLGLVTAGNGVDADVITRSDQTIERCLDRFDVVVVPGFVAHDVDGFTTLLGRGGSDLTAIYLASELAAKRCQLFKDVDGWYDADQAHGPAQRFRRLHWDDATERRDPIVQPKAVRYAHRLGRSFDVTTVQSAAATRVGGSRTQKVVAKPRIAPLRVTLLGLGTVGAEVYRRLRRRPDRFRVVAALVRNLHRPRAVDLSGVLLTDDPNRALGVPADVCVELVGPTPDTPTWIRTALQRHRHVVTANKSVLAQQGAELRTLADRQRQSLCDSATVGGAVPMLERVRQLARTQRIVALRGIVNGTGNFILDALHHGQSLPTALAQAQARGFCEQDPSADLSGQDAAHKLKLLCEAAFAKPRTKPANGGTSTAPREIMTSLTVTGISAAIELSPGLVPRLVVSARRHGHEIRGRVEVTSWPPEHPFSLTQGEHNRLEITTDSGDVIVLTGKGAGAGPTALAIIADLEDLARRRRSQTREVTSLCPA